jgi:hypothetical protein
MGALKVQIHPEIPAIPITALERYRLGSDEVRSQKGKEGEQGDPWKVHDEFLAKINALRNKKDKFRKVLIAIGRDQLN